MTSTSEQQQTPGTALSEMAGKYLTFSLGGESYAIPVLKVREIIRLTTIMAMPQMPAYIRGVINLRGKVIPVLDLRRRFGFPDGSCNEQNCIVVVQVQISTSQSKAMGVVVDAVEEVVQLAAADIEETPDFGAQIDTDFLLGMAKVKGVVKALLDIDRVISGGAFAGDPALSGALA